MNDAIHAQVVHLGPCLIFVNHRAIGMCDDLQLTVAEATDEELRELEAANEIRLVAGAAFTTPVGAEASGGMTSARGRRPQYIRHLLRR